MPLIPALMRQRQADFCECEANLIYIVSFRISRDPGIHSESLSQKEKKKKTENKTIRTTKNKKEGRKKGSSVLSQHSILTLCNTDV